MSVDPARHEQYERLRIRFIDDSDFRVSLWADPKAVLTRELGELSEAELYWINGVMIGRTPQSELIDQLQVDDDPDKQAW